MYKLSHEGQGDICLSLEGRFPLAVETENMEHGFKYLKLSLKYCGL